jgi:RNA polymerase sigma-70 factor (ECF subfamily)
VRDFATTHWSIVLLARDERSSRSAQALETLCRAYWYPLYSFVRRQGHDAHTAQDLTQEFLSRLLAARGLESVDPSKGKFRSFLLASMKHFLANEWDRLQTQRRGGGQVHFSLDAASAEERYQLEPADELTPEKIFERRWAETVIEP